MAKMQFLSAFLLTLALFIQHGFAGPEPAPQRRGPDSGRGRNSTNALQTVNLRIEGARSTIFEGTVRSNGRRVTTASGGTNRCDGTNNNASSTPGNTPTATLDTASKRANFTWDGTFGAFDDYFVTRIGPDTQTDTKFWGILVDYQFIPVGGCQYKTERGDDILFAYDAFNAKYFLKLDGPRSVRVGRPFSLTVTDGRNRTAVPGALVTASTGRTAVSNTRGQARFVFNETGTYSFKASRNDSIRSNKLEVRVR